MYNQKDIDEILTKLTYGLYLITADEYKDNGCISNTVMQVSLTPLRLAVSLNKANLTTEMISRTGKFNINILSKSADFDTFKRFGFQSGRNADKFDGVDFEKSENSLAYIKNETIGYISCTVTDTLDLGSHYLFIAEPTDSKILSAEEPVSYSYYHTDIKPKKTNSEKKVGYCCKICGYIYDGKILPNDFLCPICKHPASDFEKL